ncbi:hypothetical protein DID78_00390, partial [Candidatus Marinamargulisbacteria bacterium SCGC AG-343-D04]
PANRNPANRNPVRLIPIRGGLPKQKNGLGNKCGSPLPPINIAPTYTPQINTIETLTKIYGGKRSSMPNNTDATQVPPPISITTLPRELLGMIYEYLNVRDLMTCLKISEMNEDEVKRALILKAKTIISTFKEKNSGIEYNWDQQQEIIEECIDRDSFQFVEFLEQGCLDMVKDKPSSLDVFMLSDLEKPSLRWLILLMQKVSEPSLLVLFAIHLLRKNGYENEACQFMEKVYDEKLIFFFARELLSKDGYKNEACQLMENVKNKNYLDPFYALFNRLS